MTHFEFTNEEICRLRSSFFRLIPVSDELSGSFYSQLFTDHPEVRPNFRGDMQSQRDKLVDTLAALLDSLDRREEAESFFLDLGRRHVNYGATAELYIWVETTMLRIVDAHADEDEKQELHNLWARLLRSVTTIMQKGAQA